MVETRLQTVENNLRTFEEGIRELAEKQDRAERILKGDIADVKATMDKGFDEVKGMFMQLQRSLNGKGIGDGGGKQPSNPKQFRIDIGSPPNTNNVQLGLQSRKNIPHVDLDDENGDELEEGEDSGYSGDVVDKVTADPVEDSINIVASNCKMGLTTYDFEVQVNGVDVDNCLRECNFQMRTGDSSIMGPKPFSDAVHIHKKICCLNDAYKVFDNMPEKNTFTWNSSNGPGSSLEFLWDPGIFKPPEVGASTVVKLRPVDEDNGDSSLGYCTDKPELHKVCKGRESKIIDTDCSIQLNGINDKASQVDVQMKAFHETELNFSKKSVIIFGYVASIFEHAESFVRSLVYSRLVDNEFSPLLMSVCKTFGVTLPLRLVLGEMLPIDGVVKVAIVSSVAAKLSFSMFLLFRVLRWGMSGEITCLIKGLRVGDKTSAKLKTMEVPTNVGRLSSLQSDKGKFSIYIDRGPTTMPEELFSQQFLALQGLIFSAGKKVEMSFEKEDYRGAWFPATVLEDASHGSLLVKYQRRVVDDDEAVLHQVTVDYLHIRPSLPHLIRDRSFDLLEKVDAIYDFGWWSGVITKELADSRYIVFLKHTNKGKELTYSELRPHMDWKDGKWFSSSRQSKRGKGGETNSQLISLVKKPGRLPRGPHGVQDSICQSAEDIINISVVTCLESYGVKNARAKIAHHLLSPKSSVKQTSGQKEQLADSLTPTSVKDKDVNNSERGTLSSQKRKRGRPPKVLAQSPKISATVNKQNGDVVPNLVAAEDASKEKVDESLEKDGPSRKDDMVVNVLPSTMSDDQPLAIWFEGMHTPTVDMSGACVGDAKREMLLIYKTNQVCGIASINGAVVSDILIDATLVLRVEPSVNIPYMKLVEVSSVCQNDGPMDWCHAATALFFISAISDHISIVKPEVVLQIICLIPKIYDQPHLLQTIYLADSAHAKKKNGEAPNREPDVPTKWGYYLMFLGVATLLKHVKVTNFAGLAELSQNYGYMEDGSSLSHAKWDVKCGYRISKLPKGVG